MNKTTSDIWSKDDLWLGLVLTCGGIAAAYFQLMPVLSGGLIITGTAAIAGAQYRAGRDPRDFRYSRAIRFLGLWILLGLAITCAGGGIAILNAGVNPIVAYVLWMIGTLFGLGGIAVVFIDGDETTDPRINDPTQGPSTSRATKSKGSIESEDQSNMTTLEGDRPARDVASGPNVWQQVQQHHVAADTALSEGRLDDAETELAAAATTWVEAHVQPNTDTQEEHERLRNALERRQAASQAEDHLAEAKDALSTAEAKHEAGEYETARQKLEIAKKALSRVDVANDSNDSHPGTELSAVESEIEQLRSRIDEERPELVPDDITAKFNRYLGGISAGLSKAADAVEEDNHEQAERRLNSVRVSLTNAGELANEYDLSQEEPLDSYGAELAELQETLEQTGDELAPQEAMKSLSGMLGSIGAGFSAAEDHIETKDFAKADDRIDSVKATLERARGLNREHELGRAEALAKRQRRIESLEETVASKFDTHLTDLLETAEAAVAHGIKHRDSHAYVDAVEAFNEAVDYYTQARELVADLDRPEAWEIEERQSMVAEYLERTEEELAEQQRAVHQDLTQLLTAADERLSRAEQFVEVDDVGSARDTLEEGVRKLDKAVQQIATGVADASFQTRAEELAAKAESLHAELPEVGDTTEYRTRELVQSLQQLAAQLTESPRPELLNKYGEYPADAYLDAFGSWPEALAAANLDPVDEVARERRKYTRVEVLDALADLWDELDHPPDSSDMQQQGQMSPSPVGIRFRSWDAALELVKSVRTERETPTPTSDISATKTHSSVVSGNSTDEIPANELAELYDSFRSLQTVLESMLDADSSVTLGDSSPFAEWYDLITVYTFGEERQDEPPLGAQQQDRNSFTMDEYRSDHGDGEQITEFQTIETQGLKSSHREQFIQAGIIDPERTFHLPVAPESDKRLPIAVRTAAELEAARDLLAEFPARPSVPTQPLGEQETTTESDSETIDETSPEEQTSDSEDIVSHLLEEMGFNTEQSASD